MKRNILVLIMLTSSMMGLTACQTKSNQVVQSSETVLSEEKQEGDETSAEMAITGNALDSAIQDGEGNTNKTADPLTMWEFSDEIKRAESVYPYDDGIFISNFGDSSGGYVLYRKNEDIQMFIAPGKGLSRPTGMAVGNGMLFVCDGDAVKVYELADPGNGYREVHIDGSGHLFNDVAVNGNELYISVTDADSIYRMDVSSYEKISEESPTEWARVPGPNGITIGDNALYIASISKDFSSVTDDAVIYRIPDMSDSEIEVLLDVPGLYDGVALSDDGEVLYYSDWNTESVGAIDLVSGEVTSVYQEKGIGPADIAQSGGHLYVPDLQGSRILEFAVDKYKQ